MRVLDVLSVAVNYLNIDAHIYGREPTLREIKQSQLFNFCCNRRYISSKLFYYFLNNFPAGIIRLLKIFSTSRASKNIIVQFLQHDIKQLLSVFIKNILTSCLSS